jgi:anoctamin-8
MGNIKESLIPYAKKQMKLAKLSFDLYGALSPTEESAAKKKNDDLITADVDATTTEEIKTTRPDRTLSQVELESSAPTVSSLLNDKLFKTVL